MIKDRAELVDPVDVEIQPPTSGIRPAAECADSIGEEIFAMRVRQGEMAMRTLNGEKGHVVMSGEEVVLNTRDAKTAGEKFMSLKATGAPYPYWFERRT